MQIALGREQDGRVSQLAFQEWTVPGSAAPVLAPAVEHVLRVFETRVHELRGVAVVVGPGGFTGLRLSAAYANGLLAAASVALGAIDHLPLLAASIDHDGPFAIVTHSRRGQVYLQRFDPDGAPRAELDVLTAEAAADAVKDLPLAAGSGVGRNIEVFRKSCPETTLLPELHPSAGALLELGWACRFEPEPVEPRYVRPSDAADNVEAIAAARGMDPATARERLSGRG